MFGLSRATRRYVRAMWPGEGSPGHIAASDQKKTRAPKRHWRDWFGPVVEVMKPNMPRDISEEINGISTRRTPICCSHELIVMLARSLTLLREKLIVESISAAAKVKERDPLTCVRKMRRILSGSFPCNNLPVMDWFC